MKGKLGQMAMMAMGMALLAESNEVSWKDSVSNKEPIKSNLSKKQRKKRAAAKRANRARNKSHRS
jgi:hypothetical protein